MVGASVGVDDGLADGKGLHPPHAFCSSIAKTKSLQTSTGRRPDSALSTKFSHLRIKLPITTSSSGRWTPNPSQMEQIGNVGGVVTSRLGLALNEGVVDGVADGSLEGTWDGDADGSGVG